MKRKHSPDLLYAFALSLVFVVIDAAVFALTAEPLGSVLRFTPVWLCNVVHALQLPSSVRCWVAAPCWRWAAAKGG